MDHFGIGQALSAAARVYFQASRRSGRTTSLVESLRDGDRVVFTNENEARRVKNMCLERNVKIDTFVVDPRNPQKVFDRGTPRGRSLFDHSWVEQFYINAIEQCVNDIDHLQRETSGFGEAHLETRRKAAEMSKWLL